MLLADNNIKDRIIKLLINSDSKLSIWLEQFPDLKNNIDKWRNLGRHNNTTLSYALEERSPFHFKDNPAYNLDDFKTLFAKYILDKDFINEMTDSSSEFVEEADFWLKEYQNNNYLEIIREYLEKNISNIDKGVCANIVSYILQMNPDKDYYWNDIKPIVDEGYKNKVISEETFNKHKDFVLKKLKSATTQINITRSRDYLKESVLEGDKKTSKNLVEWIMQSNIKIDDYLKEIKPLVEIGYNKGILSKEIIEKQKNFLIKSYLSTLNYAKSKNDRKEIIDKIRELDSSHPMVVEYDEKLRAQIRKRKIKVIKRNFKIFAPIVVGITIIAAIVFSINKNVREKNKFLMSEETKGQLLFADDFSNNKNKWPVYKSFNIEIINGVYSIYLDQPIKRYKSGFFRSGWESIDKIKPNEFFGVELLKDKRIFYNFIVTAKGRKVEGNDNAYWGLDFWHTGDWRKDKAYAFMVNTNGYYEIVKLTTERVRREIMSNNDEQGLYPKKIKTLYSGYDNIISNSINFLKVVCNKYKVMVYCNNKLLKSIKVRSYPSNPGWTGFIVGHNVHVQFDDLKIYSISSVQKSNNDTQIGFINTAFANIRSGPSTKYSVIGVIKEGEKVIIMSKEGNWYRIKYNGKVGYIHEKLINR